MAGGLARVGACTTCTTSLNEITLAETFISDARTISSIQREAFLPGRKVNVTDLCAAGLRQPAILQYQPGI